MGALKNESTRKSHRSEMNHTAKRIQGLDFLRVLGTFILFAWHYPKVDGWSPFGFPGQIGYVGVDLFFVITGFLIGGLVFRAGADFSFKSFYLRRLFRTMPVYFVVVALYFLLPEIREYPNIQPLWKFLTFTLNFDLDISAFCHAWTLSATEQFYLVFPPLAFYLAAKRRIGALWVSLAALLFAGMAMRGWLWQAYIPGSSNLRADYLNYLYFPTPVRMDGFLAGTALALVKNFHPRLWSLFETRKNQIYLAIAALGTASIYLAQHLFEFAPTLIAYPLLAVSFALLVGAWSVPSAAVNRIPILGVSAVAAWSYAIYLDHRFVTQMTRAYMSERGFDPAGAPAVALSLILTLVVSALLYAAVERPFRTVQFRGGGQA
jgi:peptidoglycan/LPS O-acetylase OafA/YrhL